MLTIGADVLTPKQEVGQVVYVHPDEKRVLIRCLRIRNGFHGDYTPYIMLSNVSDLVPLRMSTLSDLDKILICLRRIVHSGICRDAISRIQMPDSQKAAQQVEHLLSAPDIQSLPECALPNLNDEFKLVWAFLVVHISENNVASKLLSFEICSLIFQNLHELKLSEDQLRSLRPLFEQWMVGSTTNPADLRALFLKARDPSIVATLPLEHSFDVPQWVFDPDCTLSVDQSLCNFTRLSPPQKIELILRAVSSLPNDQVDHVVENIHSMTESCLSESNDDSSAKKKRTK